MKPAVFLARDEHGVLHAIQPDVARGLRERGLIVQAGGEWRILRHVATHINSLFPELAACDFCSARPIAWTAACDDFITDAGARSIAEWCACETCGQLVKEKRSRELLERQVTKFGEEARPYLRRNARLFWQHYAGSIVRITN